MLDDNNPFLSSVPVFIVKLKYNFPCGLEQNDMFYLYISFMLGAVRLVYSDRGSYPTRATP